MPYSSRMVTFPCAFAEAVQAEMPHRGCPEICSRKEIGRTFLPGKRNELVL